MGTDIKRAETQRGRPRNLEARGAILRAARQILAEGGPAAVTMEGVAARAGVGKPTVYRWWPDRHAVTMAALMDVPEENLSARRAKTPIERLRQQLRRTVKSLSGTTGRHVAGLLAASEPHSEFSKAFRNHFVLSRRAEGVALLQEAVDAKMIDSELSLDAVVDALYGAMFLRLMLGHAPLTEGFVDILLRQTLRAVGSKVPLLNNVG